MCESNVPKIPNKKNYVTAIKSLVLKEFQVFLLYL